jgi:hypothetical protein
MNLRFPNPLRSLLPAIALTLVAAAALLSAQTPATQNPPPPASSTPRPAHHKHSAAHKEEPPPPPEPVPQAPPEPEQPKWPAFDPAAQASIVWDSHGLKIDAANSSLQQILKDVATDTGVKVDGLTSDERVFGTYGPGQARDVLSQLLQGSGYNVMMIGDQGGGTPRQILLSTRQAANAQPAARGNPTNSNEDDVEPEEQPTPQEQQGPVRPNFPPGGPQRSPQQIMQEMQQRQQQMQQQQQPQPQQQPQQPQQPQQ